MIFSTSYIRYIFLLIGFLAIGCGSETSKCVLNLTDNKDLDSYADRILQYERIYNDSICKLRINIVPMFRIQQKDLSKLRNLTVTSETVFDEHICTLYLYDSENMDSFLFEMSKIVLYYHEILKPNRFAQHISTNKVQIDNNHWQIRNDAIFKKQKEFQKLLGTNYLYLWLPALILILSAGLMFVLLRKFNYRHNF